MWPLVPWSLRIGGTCDLGGNRGFLNISCFKVFDINP